MKMNVAQWLACSAACMAVGCSGLERHIRSSENASAYTSPISEAVTSNLQSEPVSQSTTSANALSDQGHASRSQPVSQAVYAQQSTQAAGVFRNAFSCNFSRD